MKNQSETKEPINITPMTLDEARECVAAIRSSLESLGAMLLDLERRRGWEALGYSSFRECAMAEFGKSQGYVYKLLHAAEVDENLAASEIYPMDKSEIALIPTSHKEELHKLPSDQQAEALQKANAIAQAEGKSRQVKHVRQVVKEYKSVAQETAALGESLGLPTREDSVLPQNDLLDDLTQIRPADVDDRLGAPSPRLYRHQVGEIVFVSNQSKMPFEQRMWSRCWGVVKSVGDVSVTVSFGQREGKFMALDLIRHEQLSSQFREFCQKILNLWQEELEPMEAIILRELQHKEAFTPWEIQLISWMEAQHTKLN